MAARCCLTVVGAELQRPLQAQGGDPVLPGREQPARGEPDRQRSARAFKDGSRGDRGPAAAARAHDAPIAEGPTLAVAATRTGEPRRPPKPVEIVVAIRIGPEPRLELTHRPRIVLASARTLHSPSLLRLNGYPQKRVMGHETRRRTPRRHRGPPRAQTGGRTPGARADQDGPPAVTPAPHDQPWTRPRAPGAAMPGGGPGVNASPPGLLSRSGPGGSPGGPERSIHVSR